MTRYRGLILDFGGVLTSSLQEAMAAFAGELGLELQDLVRIALSPYAGGDDPLITGFETGRVSEERFAAELAQRLSEATGRRIEPDGLIERIFGRLRLEEDMFAAVAAARRAGLRTALCSNSWGDSLYPAGRLRESFDAVVISGEVGLRKPDPAIFELTLRRLELPAEACVFVDDHPGHLHVAAALGLTTVLHRDPPATIAELGELLGLELGPGAPRAQR